MSLSVLTQRQHGGGFSGRTHPYLQPEAERLPLPISTLHQWHQQTAQLGASTPSPASDRV